MATETGTVGGRCERVKIDWERVVNVAFPFDKNCASWTSYMHADVGRDDGGWGGVSSLIHDDLVRSLYRSAGTWHHRRRKRPDLPSTPPTNAFDGPQLVYEDECPHLAYMEPCTAKPCAVLFLCHTARFPGTIFFHIMGIKYIINLFQATL